MAPFELVADVDIAALLPGRPGLPVFVVPLGNARRCRRAGPGELADDEIARLAAPARSLQSPVASQRAKGLEEMHDRILVAAVAGRREIPRRRRTKPAAGIAQAPVDVAPGGERRKAEALLPAYPVGVGQGEKNEGVGVGPLVGIEHLAVGGDAVEVPAMDRIAKAVGEASARAGRFQVAPVAGGPRSRRAGRKPGGFGRGEVAAGVGCSCQVRLKAVRKGPLSVGATLNQRAGCVSIRLRRCHSASMPAPPGFLSQPTATANRPPHQADGGKPPGKRRPIHSRSSWENR